VAQFFILVFHVLVSLEGTHSLMIQAYDDEGVVCGALVSCAITDARTIQQLPGLLDLHDGIVRGPMLNRQSDNDQIFLSPHACHLLFWVL
jgi:hypothetical protein